jgi:hypothetical protein
MATVTSCPSCGARVDAAPAAETFVYTCRFCSARVPIEPLLPRPAPGIPEVVRIAAAVRQAQVASAPSATVVKAARGVGCFVIVTTLLPFLIVGAVFLGPGLWGYVAGHYGSFPMEVPMNGSLEITDRTETGTDTMVTMGVNGKLTLRRCHLKGPLVVKGGVNAQVTVIDSSLEGQKGVIEGETNLVVVIQNSTITSAEEIVDSPVNAKISISKDSKLHSDAVAFPLESNAEIAIDHSSLEGRLGGIELRVNGHVKLTDGAVVKSDGPAIELAQNGHLAITASRVESKTEAIRAGNNVEGTLRSAVLVGPKGALEVGDNGRLTIAQTTITGPRKIGANARIDER